MSIPKNYISAGISKNLLTPCRRIGLSRSKKTPKIACPVTPVPNLENNAPNKNIGSTDKKNIHFEERPKRLSTSKQVNKSINKVDIVLDNSKDNNSFVGLEVTESKLAGEITCNKVNNETHNAAKNKKKRIIIESPNKSTALKSPTEVQLHHPVAKRSINFNISDKFPTKSPMKEENVNKSKINIAENNSPCSYQVEGNPLENLEENAFKDAVIGNKKRRLRLDSDDFASNENVPESINSSKTHQVSPKVSKIKNETTLNTCITLGRFTTEDYLKEYSSNPEKFQENLEDSSVTTTIIRNDNHIEIEAFSNIQKNIKAEKMMSEKCDDTSGSGKKDYVAIVCPSTNQNTSQIKTKRSLSTKKSSLESKKPLENIVFTSNSKLKHNLTVNLERLTKENLKRKVKSEGNKEIQLKDLPSNPELMTFTSAHIKINILADDDNELFTSSPELDKKQCDNLAQLIRNMENEIKQKQDKLEKLIQAQVYKKKHSPEKLKVSSDMWLEGCRASLEDLLLKMQEHGPMEMDTLTKKLRIPNDILEKLKI